MLLTTINKLKTLVNHKIGKVFINRYRLQCSVNSFTSVVSSCLAAGVCVVQAQLKRRSAAVDSDAQAEAQTPPSVPSRSPRTPSMTLGPRVLPPADAKDAG